MIWGRKTIFVTLNYKGNPTSYIFLSTILSMIKHILWNQAPALYSFIQTRAVHRNYLFYFITIILEVIHEKRDQWHSCGEYSTPELLTDFFCLYHVQSMYKMYQSCILLKPVAWHAIGPITLYFGVQMFIRSKTDYIISF